MAIGAVVESDGALASGQLLKCMILEPIAALVEIFRLMGRKETNFVVNESFTLTRPILFVVFSKELVEALMGKTSTATKKWTEVTVLMPLSALDIGTTRNLTRILSDNLKNDMPGVELCTPEGAMYWSEQFTRAENSDSRKAVLARSDLDPVPQARLIAYLYERLELLVADFGSPTYSREALDAQYPVEQGLPHYFVSRRAHLRAQSSRLKDPKMRRDVSARLTKLPQTAGEWRQQAIKELAEQSLKQPSSSAPSAPAGTGLSIASVAAACAAIAGRSSVVATTCTSLTTSNGSPPAAATASHEHSASGMPTPSSLNEMDEKTNDDDDRETNEELGESTNGQGASKRKNTTRQSQRSIKQKLSAA